MSSFPLMPSHFSHSQLNNSSLSPRSSRSWTVLLEVSSSLSTPAWLVLSTSVNQKSRISPRSSPLYQPSVKQPSKSLLTREERGTMATLTLVLNHLLMEVMDSLTLKTEGCSLSWRLSLVVLSVKASSRVRYDCLSPLSLWSTLYSFLFRSLYLSFVFFDFYLNNLLSALLLSILLLSIFS